MELATRVFDVITDPDHIYHEEIRKHFPEISNKDEKAYWRRVLRMAALCHDLGHLPFSHAAEKSLLPEGWDHERITKDLILSEEMKKVWEKVKPPLMPDDVVKLAVGVKKAVPGVVFSEWETILSEIIVGDAFGVDRMDYLLRDSYHAGVAYGRFDHYRLIDTLRILPPPASGNKDKEHSTEPSLGVEEGGIQSAEALALARYFMFSQVYFHAVRRIYDIHLKDFLLEYLEGGHFPTDLEKFLLLTDNEIISAMRSACNNSALPGHTHSDLILNRKHFKILYGRIPDDIVVNPSAPKMIYQATVEKYGDTKVRYDSYRQSGGDIDFPVFERDGSVVSSTSVSALLQQLKPIAIDFVFADRSIFNAAETWLKDNKSKIIAIKGGEAK
jgi:hypothetical protein